MKSLPVSGRNRLGHSVTILSIILILIGIFILFKEYSTTRPVVTEESQILLPDTSVNLDLGEPVNLSINKINTNLPIKNGYYDSASRRWTLDNIHAFYMQGSATPIIYGHNQEDVFNQLFRLIEGDEMVITTADGRKLVFSYIRNKVLRPEDSWLLEEKNENTVILLTCTGLFLESRQALYFNFTKEIM